MTAPSSVMALAQGFVECFTQPGFQHFVHFLLAHATLMDSPHCVSETLRATRRHAVVHWTTPYAFMNRGRWSCAGVSRALLALLLRTLGITAEAPLIVAIDDTLCKKWGRNIFGLCYYPDPTDKNPGASRHRVRALCWVVAALVWERAAGQWMCFPLGALLFVPLAACPPGWVFRTKIELAVWLLERLGLLELAVILLVDNLYAKGPLARLVGVTLVSRLRSNAALYEPPPPRKPGQRGRPRKRGAKCSARGLWRRKSGRRDLTVRIYGKLLTITAWVGVMIPSRTLGEAAILVVIFPQRGGKKMNVFFTTDLTMAAERVLELYGARFKIEAVFKELKTHGGMGDCRQRSFAAGKRHVTLCLVAYSLLRALSVTLRGGEAIEAEPWWHPSGPPSVKRLSRWLNKSLGISCSLQSGKHIAKNLALREAA